MPAPACKARLDLAPTRATVFADRVESIESLWRALLSCAPEWRRICVGVDPESRIGLSYVVRVVTVLGDRRWQVFDENGVRHTLTSLADHSIGRAVVQGRAWLDNRAPSPVVSKARAPEGAVAA